MRDAPFALTLPAPAKLNLGLEVLGRRADGYHDLATIFLTVSLFDEVSVKSVPGVAATTPNDVVPPWENLTIRAAQAMQTAAPGRGADIEVTKRIPVAAGLGGASSDAAATLLALRELWQAPVSDAALAEMALELGSDVPFLLRGGYALGRGRGERLEGLPLPGERSSSREGRRPSAGRPSPPAPLPMRGRGENEEASGESSSPTRVPTSPPEGPSPDARERGWGEGRPLDNGRAEIETSLSFLIVAPRIVLPRKTARLFAALQPGDFSDGARVATQAERLRAGLPLDANLLGNTFSRALYELCPEAQAAAAAMREAGATHVAVSGAGPAHYAVFDDPAMAQLVKRRLADRLGNTAEVFLTVPVPARELTPSAGMSDQP